MRTFAVIAHKFRGEVNLNDLPGSGRTDLIARCINAAIFLSHDIRRDVLFFFFAPEIQTRVKIDSSRVKYLNPDERSTAALIRNAIIKKAADEIESSPGFFVKEEHFEEFLAELKALGTLYYLHENGHDVRAVEFPKKSVFFLSDSMNMENEEEKKIDEISEKRVSVGEKSILASHAICIVNNELDRRCI